MTFSSKFFFPSSLFVAMALLLFSCVDKGTPNEKGQMEFKITDAPIDDAEVSGVFITVAEVQIDGQPVAAFEGKQTIDILAYQNGRTKSLGTADLDAKSYNQITLVLDNETDASGNAPGCYVKMKDGAVHKLATNGQAQTEITMQAAFDIAQEAKTNAVIDFDLRKAIKYDQSGGSKSFSFVSNAELDQALRVENEEMTATINGTLTENTSSDELVVAYIYNKGEFNQSTETQAQGESGLMFKNAITSAVVVNDSYTLSFLKEGDYEVCFATYNDEDQDGTMEFEGFLQTSLSLTGNVTSAVTVEAGVDLSLSIEIFGLIK